jgi:CHRD domain
MAMTMRLRCAAAAFAAAAAGCSQMGQTPTQPDVITTPLFVNAADGGSPENHRTHLSGREEVFTPATPDAPTPADSRAQGQATFQISPDGTSVDYKLIASNIENVTQAHIHCAPAGVNGPIVMWLYPSPTATAALPGGAGRHDGVLAEGTFTAANVRPTANPNCPGGVATFADLLARLREGNAYANVHTSDGVAPINQGPGDFPGGEIRGQVE